MFFPSSEPEQRTNSQHVSHKPSGTDDGREPTEHLGGQGGAAKTQNCISAIPKLQSASDLLKMSNFSSAKKRALFMFLNTKKTFFIINILFPIKWGKVDSVPMIRLRNWLVLFFFVLERIIFSWQITVRFTGFWVKPTPVFLLAMFHDSLRGKNHFDPESSRICMYVHPLSHCTHEADDCGRLLAFLKCLKLECHRSRNIPTFQGFKPLCLVLYVLKIQLWFKINIM